MSYINNTKQTTMFQTTPQTHLIIKTEILVTLDGFLKVWLIIINNILDIVSKILKKKSPLSSMVSLTMASPSNFSTSYTRLLLSSSLVSSLLFCLMLFCLLSKVTTDASLRVLFFAFLYICF